MIELHAYPPGEDETGIAVLESVRDVVRGHAGISPVTILLHAGHYPLERPFALTPPDFGTPDTPITWCASGDGEVVVTGTRTVVATRSSRTGSATASLTAGTTIGSVLLDGDRLHSARYPNHDRENPYFGGFLAADTPPPGEEPQRDRFWCRDAALQAHDLVGAELVVFPRHNYRNNRRLISGHDLATGEIRLASPTTYEIDPDDRFYIQHLPAALDAAGEWSIDEDGLLRVIPPDDRLELWLDIPVVDHLLVVRGANEPAPDFTVDNWPFWDDDLRRLPEPSAVPETSLTIGGITFEGSIDTAVQMENVAGTTISACTIRHAGNHGVAVVGGRDCRIEACEVSSTGSDGILVAAGMRRPFNWLFARADHRVTNCYVHHVGLDDKHVACINVAGVGNAIEHCLVHDGPRWGILFRGNHHRIAGNHVRHVNIETADTAGIYCCDRDRTMYGTEIRGNMIHDVLGYNRTANGWQTPSYAFGIYLDDWTSGVTVHGNLTWNTVRGGIYLNSGSDNVVTNNCFIGGQGELGYFNRWDARMEAERVGTYHDGLRRNRIEGNVFVGPTGGAPVYGLGRMLSADDETDVKTNIWDRNVIWNHGHPLEVRAAGAGGTRMISWAEWRDEHGQDRASLIADPLLRNDFTLSLGSPALANGFEPLPIDRMGLQPVEGRLDWPPPEAVGVREHQAAAGVRAR